MLVQTSARKHSPNARVQSDLLDARTRAFREARFGHDFSQGRVDTDVCAVESAETLDALAFLN